LSKQLSDELEAEAIVRVNCIDPGTVKTELFGRAFPAKDPTGLAKADDIVASYLYLMGKDSVKKTGKVIKAQ
jgi:NAD(P)-dependent dehydrogenase (short-subunit alcohol dehydrogenase family)